MLYINKIQQYLVSTVKQLDLLVIPPSRPGPYARTRVGSHPSTTDTLKGLLGTGASSYSTSIRCIPGHRYMRCHTSARMFSKRTNLLCYCHLLFNYGPDKFPFREINICLFIKRHHLARRRSGERTRRYICSLFIILLQHFF